MVSHTSFYKNWENRNVKPEEILGAIRSIENPKFRALAAFLYLTGCRIEEVLPYQGCQEWSEKRGIKVKQLTYPEGHDNDTVPDFCPPHVIVEGVRNLKRKVFRCQKREFNDEQGIKRTVWVKDETKRMPASTLYRSIPINIGVVERPFWTVFWEYAKNQPLQEELWPSTTRYDAYHHICGRTDTNKKGITTVKTGGGINLHALRHQRLTHLAIRNKLHPQQLRRFVGWASSTTADNYVESGTQDILEQQKRGE
jgi:integrase